MTRAETPVETMDEVWTTCAEALQAQVSEPVWQMYLSTISATSSADGQLTLVVPDSVIFERVSVRYLDMIRDTVASTLHRPTEEITLHLEVAVADPSTDAAPDSFDDGEDDGPVVGLAGGTGTDKGTGGFTEGGSAKLDPRYTFEDYIVADSSNRFAYSAAMSVAETPARSYNPLFIYGDSGLGKTHLLHSIGNYVGRNLTHLKVLYVTTETYMNEFVNAIRTNATTEFKRRYRECDVLLIDDVQFMERKESLQEEFFHTFNSLFGASKQIVLTSDRPPKAIATLEDRLRSRFLSGLITEVQPPSIETRIAILTFKASKQHLDLPDDVADFIATNVTTNIRELEGALIRVAAFASLSSRPIDLELAEGVLSDIVSENKPRRITPQVILDATAETFGFSIEELTGPNRRRPLVTARQISMYVFRELTDFSYPAIGREFGGRDHATVMHAISKITNLMQERRQIYEQVTDLILKIKAG